MSQKKRILSGMRPTGPLHLGNLLGALANWVNMQDDYECYFFIADWHALTSDYDNTEPIANNRKEIMIDWLSAGLTPEKSTLFVQSQVKEHAELFLLLTMITPVPWLERNPTYKEQIGELPIRTCPPLVSWAIRSCRLPTLSYTSLMVSPSAWIRPPMSKSPAKSRGASTIFMATCFRSLQPF